MIYVLIGHRGTGKTSFLERIRHYYQTRHQEVVTIDLDAEIISEQKNSIERIFSERGEQYFRQLEIATFARILDAYKDDLRPVYIAVGAGFKGDIPLYVKIIWLQRPSDHGGRIFLDRPRLDEELAPLDEYFMRAEARQNRFQEIYHKEIHLGEGFHTVNDIEPVLLGLVPYDLRASITVMPHVFANEVRLEDFIADKLLMGVRYFELRDDLLTVEQMEKLALEVPAERLLFSFRTRDKSAIREDWRWSGVYDWALDLGPCPFGRAPILSLHKREDGESVEECGRRLIREKAEHYKLAVPVNDFLELWQGHQWYLEDPVHRSFLPMSRDGRWSWYRLIHGQKMRLQFVRDGIGSAKDQPTIFDWIRVQKARGISKGFEFVAVLGDPVELSRTPAEQGGYFARRQWPVVSLPMREGELNEMNMSLIRRLGLQAAAVTAPLKAEAFRLCREYTADVRRIASVNTLIWNARGNCWAGTNTDVLALEKIFENLNAPLKVAVWGGGGTRRALQTAVPQARFFSARTGHEVDASGVELTPDPEDGEFAPQMVIWAVGRDRMPACKWPPPSWKPLMVFDLNYLENSPGREYTQKVGAQYISGLEMFQEQARAQQKFWDALLPEIGEKLQL